ncbi:anthranilate phosphoribosyltransferase [Telmatospirillum sp.]|uniref:anthranilate phosphoribosyltransferase n=1 Tax=Telmatospirillum sp. TaxID=2079197 RepID=UPI002846C18C|nr:anthranilate phosphoribosyltransferase [Telmatospirillum sp.]MDR3441021.1 anthranilate phosphoribosyltransferase [Telmatospirillum sp.]
MTTIDLMKTLLAKVAGGQSLSEDEAERAFDIIMSGDATPAQIGGFLMALRVRGETVAEITGAARIMRAKATTIDAPSGAIDTCGTGGDASGTFNISTAAALVVAGAGVPVAKHGNRALSSKSGSADVLAALGVKIDADNSLVRESLWQNHIGFLMAPRHHAAMRHVAGPRVELGTRTLFNLLGPLANPAETKRQVVGVFAEMWVEPLAEVLGRLGAERAWVVHGSDGLDELTTTGPSSVAEWRDGRVHRFSVSPADAGLPQARPADLKGGDAAANAAALRRLLAGEKGAYRDIVLLNAAAALIVADAVSDLAAGVVMAARAIDQGSALATLDRLVAITNRTIAP